MTTGLDNVMAKFNFEVAKIKRLTEEGLIRASIVVERSWNNETPRIPVDTGNLRQSWFAITSKSSHSKPHDFKGKNAGKLESSTATTEQEARGIIAGRPGQPTMVMGFGANYAADVENTRKNYRRPDSGAHFFQSAITRNEGKMLMKIRETIKL